MLLRHALAPNTIPGIPTSESWGHLFASQQVGRWLTGTATIGHADLLAWPFEQLFWPTNPVLQLLQAPLALLFGAPAALIAVTWLLLFLAGWGPFWLGRGLGATRWCACIGGLAVQSSPFLIRNFQDMILEMGAIGVLAIAGRLCWLSHGGPKRNIFWPAIAVGLLAGISPYYAIFLAMALVPLVLSTHHLWRHWLRLSLGCGFTSLLVAAPLVSVETTAGGRLGPEYQQQGYQLIPSPLVVVEDITDGSPTTAWGWTDVPRQRMERPGPTASHPNKRHPALDRLMRFPGGATILFGCLIALCRRDSRRVATFSLVLFCFGPGPWLLLRECGWVRGPPQSLIQIVLNTNDITGALGNPTRFFAPYIVMGATTLSLVISSFSVRSTKKGLLATLLAICFIVLELGLVVPDFALPVTQTTAPNDELDTDLFQAVEGPMVVFPSGEPPYWHPKVAPKESLYVAGLFGAPGAADFGRGRTPADIQIMVELAAASGTPIGRQTIELATETPGASFPYLLVLEDRLSENQRAATQSWLSKHALKVRQGNDVSVWRLATE